MLQEESPERRGKLKTIAEDLIQRGVEKGLRQGLERGKADLLGKQIVARFPKLPDEVYPKIQKLSVERLDVLGTELWKMHQWQELERFF